MISMEKLGHWRNKSITLRRIQLEQIEQIEDKITTGYIISVENTVQSRNYAAYKSALGSKDFTGYVF